MAYKQLSKIPTRYFVGFWEKMRILTNCNNKTHQKIRLGVGL